MAAGPTASSAPRRSGSPGSATRWPSASPAAGGCSRSAPRPQARSDARHVAVEFVHPVIVGKRALPALGAGRARAGRWPSSSRCSPSPTTSSWPSARVAGAAPRSRARAAAYDRLRPPGAEWELEPPSADPCVRQELVETAYHVLWELVHVFFEHRGLLSGRDAGRTHDSGASSFLYPFLGETETDLDAVLDDVRRSIAVKAARSARCASRRSRRARRAGRRRRGLRGGSTRGGAAARARQRRLGDRRDGRGGRPALAAAGRGRRGRRSTSPRTRRSSPRWPTTSAPTRCSPPGDRLRARRRRAAGVLDQRRLGQRDRRAGRGAPARAADGRLRRLRRRADRRRRGSPTTCSSPARSTSRASRRRRRAPTTCCASCSRRRGERGGGRPSRARPRRRDRAGRRLPPVRPPAGRASSGSAASCATTSTGCCSRSRARPRPSTPSSSGCRGTRRRWRAIERVEPVDVAAARLARVRDRGERARGAAARAGRAGRGDLRGLPARAARSGRPPLPLSVRQLHELRPALHDRARRPVRPRAHDDGRLRDVRRVPRRVRGPGRPALPRAAERVPRLRAAAAARDGDGAGARRSGRRSPRRRCAAGAIVAVKGLGGFHLACRADDERAVATLRARKHREDKPFALMAADAGAAAVLVELAQEAEALLCGPERPIVLAPRRADARGRRGGGAGRARARRDAPVLAAAPPAAGATPARRS